MMNDQYTMMHDQGFVWTTALGFGHGWIGPLILMLLILGGAALIKYLISSR
ncbi:hypothetical protein [Thioalkalivibrio halophilus]|uniref:hypothetical protein n=1 Tax=Thioalkalivibrio halophilus TaxID=252474 RepID=UPI001300DA87|nr:hypothetical protein [Thioalkalivibrio halophilus]